MDISDPQLHVLVLAVRDALTLAVRDLKAQGEDPEAGLEEYIVSLESLQADLKREYERRRAAGENLLSHALLVGPPRFRKL